MVFSIIFIVAAIVFAGVCILSLFYTKYLFRCKKCKSIYDDEDIDWEVVKTNKEVTGPNNEYSNQDTKIKVYAHVKYTCTCQNCGEVKNFKERFTVKKFNLTTGSAKEYNVSELAEKFISKNLAALEKAEAKKAIKEERQAIKKEEKASAAEKIEQSQVVEKAEGVKTDSKPTQPVNQAKQKNSTVKMATIVIGAICAICFALLCISLVLPFNAFSETLLMISGAVLGMLSPVLIVMIILLVVEVVRNKKS